MNDILTGIPCNIDDVLLSGENPKGTRLQTENSTPRTIKSRSDIEREVRLCNRLYTGHFTRGITTGPDNVETTTELLRPENVSELQ